MQSWRVRQALNALNGSTLLGLALAVGSRSHLVAADRGTLLATRSRLRLPGASAFTVGDVVLTHHDASWVAARPRLLRHEQRHSWQYAACLGLPMLPLYGAAAAWSLLRGGDAAVHNAFERWAGLADGGYPTISRRARLRRSAA
ncbi:MAG: hypothetical protein ACTHKG_16760 [Nocardioides sp.]